MAPPMAKLRVSMHRPEALCMLDPKLAREMDGAIEDPWSDQLPPRQAISRVRTVFHLDEPREAVKPYHVAPRKHRDALSTRQ